MLRLALFVCLIVGSLAYGETERHRRVKVALALLASKETCGQCRVDLQACRDESFATGKPVIVFVGDCSGSDELRSQAIVCRLSSYKGDDKPEGEKRIVILTPGKDNGKQVMYISATMPITATATEIRAKAGLPEPKKVNWFI